MHLEIHAPNGSLGYVDNTGQENGKVKITGDGDIVRTLDRLLNKDFKLVGPGAKSRASRYPEELILKDKKIWELHKASDKYIVEYFIPIAKTSFDFISLIL